MPFYSLCCLRMLETETEGQMRWMLKAVGQDRSKWDSRERRGQ